MHSGDGVRASKAANGALRNCLSVVANDAAYVGRVKLALEHLVADKKNEDKEKRRNEN